MLRQEPQPRSTEQSYLGSDTINLSESSLPSAPIAPMSYGTFPEEPIPNEGAARTIDIHRELNRMEELVLDSPRIPLSNRTLIDEERLLEQLDAIRLALPMVLQEAMGIVQQKNAIFRDAEKYAQEIIASAEQRAIQVLDETSLVRQAELEAAQTRQQLQQECSVLRDELLAEMEQIKRQAQQEAEDMRHMAIAECQEIQQGADDYADRVLSNMERQLMEMVSVVRNGRQQLQGDKDGPKG
ncbi:MAG: DivIVA domain-containing protein [Cyanobacteria bacterium P01_F01_bin.150]